MKISWKNCLRVSLCAFLLFAAISHYREALMLLRLFLAALSPVLLGAVIAYLVNILMAFYERFYFPGRQKAFFVKSRRPVCLCLAILSMLLLVGTVAALVLPRFITCMELLLQKIPPALERFFANEKVAALLPSDWKAALAGIDWEAGAKRMLDVLKTGLTGAVNNVIGAVSSLFSHLVNGLLALIFALYLLLGKDSIKNCCSRLLDSYLPVSWNRRFRYVWKVLDECFHKYIVGQCLEAAILGVLCALGMLLFRLPYAGMIGALVGLTALIPIAGAYIGAGVGAFMILTVSPLKALLFLAFILVLQQLEGNLIYPKVVGSSIGLPGILVLAAVTVGGALYGILGMLIAVPLAAAAFRLIKEDLEKREKIKES